MANNTNYFKKFVNGLILKRIDAGAVSRTETGITEEGAIWNMTNKLRTYLNGGVKELLMIPDGYTLDFTIEDANSTITMDNSNLEIESTDGTQRTFKITSAKAGNTTLTLEENFTIGDGFDVTITAEDVAGSIVLDKQTVEFEGEQTATQLMKFINASNAAATLTIDGTSGSVDQNVTSGSSPAFTSATLTTPVLNTSISGTAFLDEDNMASNSAVKVSSQQSIKAYVDAQVTAQDLDFQGDAGGALSIDLDSETLIIAGGTGIDTSGASKTLTVNIDSTVVTLTGSQTLTNKILSDDTTYFGDSADLTKKLEFELVGATTAKTMTITSSHTDNRVITIPDITDTLVGKTTTDTLTNKTLTDPDINGGTADSLTGFSIRSSGAAYDLEFDIAEVLTGNKIVSWDVGDGNRSLTFNENFTIGNGFDVNITAEDTTTTITMDNVNFEVESTDATQRTFKITSAKAGNTTLTLEENFTIGDGFDVTITAEDVAGSIVLDKQTVEFEGEQTATRLMKFINASDAAATLTIDGTSGSVDQNVTSGSSPAFTSATLTTPVLNTSISGTAFLDEDNMASNSAVKVSSQQSIKAYVDANVTGLDNVVNKTTTYTATTSDNVITIDTSGGVWTLTLYTAAGNTGRRLKLIKTTSDFNKLTIDGNGAETINGSTTKGLFTQNESMVIVSNGTNWIIESHSIPSVPTSFTPTLNSNTNVSSNTAFWTRLGKYMLVDGRVTYDGTGAASDFSYTLPSGFSIATSDLAAQTGATESPPNSLTWQESGVARRTLSVLLSSSTRMNMNSTTGGVIQSDLFSSGDIITYSYRVPISQWEG